MSSSVGVNRTTFRVILLGLMLLSAAFAAWSWMRPYEWTADDSARCRIVGCQVEKDHDNYWVKLQLKINQGESHDLSLPVELEIEGGPTLEPADTTLEGDSQKAVRQVWLQFWLEEEDMARPMALRINEGKLTVRSGRGYPKLRSDGSRYYVSHRW